MMRFRPFVVRSGRLQGKQLKSAIFLEACLVTILITALIIVPADRLGWYVGERLTHIPGYLVLGFFRAIPFLITMHFIVPLYSRYLLALRGKG
jgi:hypothetical protein